MPDHPLQGLMTTAMESLKEMIDVNTIIGDPVETPDGSVILTVSKVGFGFAAGGSEFKLDSSQNSQSSKGSDGQQGKSSHPFGGGSGGGVSITPIAFLIVKKDEIKLLHLAETTHLYERILDFAPQAVEKIQQMLSKNNQGPKNDGDQQNNNKDKQKKKESESKNQDESGGSEDESAS
ncbi:GerW family sporulation protein [Bacillus sp. T33-2]|uniref:GerW family sporulation protein n=1 Tax=Bacillus sp. T33-2 TaxID=2054168 RepID=UPI000C79548E|nr:GerW family sporulation protein [Bacillus sp. T33-2]PLR98147.1 sporulation protein YtfJ [Bacillus sp. T33-2]